MQGPAALTSAQVQIAVKPALGGEMRVYVTRDPALELANIQIVAANSGINQAGSPYAYNQTALTNEANGYPMDLVVIAENTLVDTGTISVLVTGLDQNGVVQSGLAIFETPAYASVTDQIFETGWAADVVPLNPTPQAAGAANGAQWSAYLSFQVTCTSLAQYGGFSIWAMPNLSRYTLIGATQEKSMMTRAQRPTAISAGLDEGAWIKPGVKPVGEARVRCRWISLGDAFARFDGANITMRIDVVKEQKIVDQRFFGMGGTMSVTTSAGELASVGEFDASLMYSELAIMIAQQVGSPSE